MLVRDAILEELHPPRSISKPISVPIVFPSDLEDCPSNIYDFSCLMPSTDIASKVAPYKYRRTCPSQFFFLDPPSSKVDIESKCIINPRTNNIPINSRNPLDSSYNLTHPTSFTTCMVLDPQLTWNSKPLYKMLLNTNLILVMWLNDLLSSSHNPLSSYVVVLKSVTRFDLHNDM